MSNIESLSELAIWEEYRSFMKERLKQLPSGDSPFLLSKTKVDFNISGQTWKGHAVLVGLKGAATAKKLKSDGVSFREAKCQPQGTELIIKDLDEAAIKLAAATLRKLNVGFSISGVGSPGDESATPLAATAQLDKRLANLLADINRASALTTKETEPLLEQARRRAQEAKALFGTDQIRATTLLQEGEEFARQALVGVLEGGEPTEAIKIETRREELLNEISEAEKLNNPANKDLIDKAKQAAQAVLVAVGKKQYDAVENLFDSIEGMLSQMVEGPEPAANADPDLAGIGDWKEYRTFMRAQVKRLPKEGGPAFISKEKLNFTINGKPFQGNVILVGQKGRVLVQILRRAGTLFMEGTAKVEERNLRVGGIKLMLLKGATKTMLKLKLGLRIGPDGSLPPDEDEEAEDATLDPIGKQSIDKEVKEVAEALIKLRDGLDKQRKSLAGLKQEAEEKRKAADTAAKRARELGDKGTDTPKDWDDMNAANMAAETAKFTAKRAATDADRAANEFREMTERLHRIRDTAEPEDKKKAALKKLKAEVTGRLLDLAVVNLDPKDPKAGKVIADQIKKRFGVSFNLNESKITGRDANGRQIFKDNDKKLDPNKEAEALKELYLTLSRAPVFPASHLKTLTISLRPKNSESEGGVYYEDSRLAEVTCRRPKESFNYGDQLNSRAFFPDGIDENCKAANADPVNYFDWATLHEVAHAVDAKNKFMATNASGNKYGAWVDYGNKMEPIATVVANEFGKSLGVDEKKQLEKYALALMKNSKPGAPKTPEQTLVKNWVDSVRVGRGLWWDGSASKSLAIGGRVYQESYDFGGGQWNSYDLAARKQGIHGYQFRAPGEWFAELYAAYYSDKLKASHPFVPDLAKLETPN